jgi:hypothetical protein
MVKMTKPLRAAEYVVPVAVLVAAVISIIESVVSDEGREVTSTVSQLIEQYEIVSVLLGVLAVFAITQLCALSVPETHRTLRIRQVCLFAMSIGLFFIGILALTSLGVLHILWVNELALSAVSAILYLHLRVTLNEYKQ